MRMVAELVELVDHSFEAGELDDRRGQPLVQVSRREVEPLVRLLVLWRAVDARLFVGLEGADLIEDGDQSDGSLLTEFNY